jgi:hypothetical protein
MEKVHGTHPHLRDSAGRRRGPPSASVNRNQCKQLHRHSRGIGIGPDVIPLHPDNNVSCSRGKNASPKVLNKWVNLEYPQKLGIIERLTAEGYQLKWESANNESVSIDIEG